MPSRKGRGESRVVRLAEFEILEGEHAIFSVLEQGQRKVFTIFVREARAKGGFEKKLHAIRSLAKRYNVPVKIGPAPEIPKNGWIAAQVGPFVYAAIDDFKPSTHPLICLFDRIQDPQNLGAMLRSCVALGASAVVIPRHESVGVTAIAVKAAAGAAELLPIARVTNLRQALETLKEIGYFTVAAMPQGDPLQDAHLDLPLALVVGNEGQGVGDSLAKSCDQQVAIPMEGRFESLNVSVCLGIMLFEISRRRK